MATWAPGMALGHLFSKGQELGSESSQGRDYLIHPALIDAALSAWASASYSSAVLSSLRRPEVFLQSSEVFLQSK